MSDSMPPRASAIIFVELGIASNGRFSAVACTSMMRLLPVTTRFISTSARGLSFNKDCEVEHGLTIYDANAGCRDIIANRSYADGA